MKLFRWFILLCVVVIGSCTIYLGTMDPDRVINQTLQEMDRDADEQFQKSIDMWKNHGR